MQSKETERKNGIRTHVNNYDLFGDPLDLVKALPLIYKELLYINTNYETFLIKQEKKNNAKKK